MAAEIEPPVRSQERQRWAHPPFALVAVAAGGMVGATARYGVSAAVGERGDAFPLATFVENVSGSFLLGFVLIAAVARFPALWRLRLFLTTGVLGSYTTYATFVVEGDVLIRDGRLLLAFGYWWSSALAGVIAAFLGIAAARSLHGQRSAP